MGNCCPRGALTREVDASGIRLNTLINSSEFVAEQGTAGQQVSLQMYLPVRPTEPYYKDTARVADGKDKWGDTKYRLDLIVYGTVNTEAELKVVVAKVAREAVAKRAEDMVDEDESDWKRLGGVGLELLLRFDAARGDSPVKLLDARFLVSLALAGGVLCRRQDLPPDAFLELDALREMRGGDGTLRVICISYPWLQPDHPDPKATTLRLVANVLQHFLLSRGGTYGVFLDFCSLHQNPRTDAQDALFKTALGSLSDLYSHPNTRTLKATRLPEAYPAGFVFPEGRPANQASYYGRGWCSFESSAAHLVKESNMVFDLANFTGTQTSLGGVENECKARRPPPVPRSEFMALLETRSFTNKTGDLAAVDSLYQRAVETRFATAQELNYYGLGWKDEEAKVLSRALGEAKALQRLVLSGNNIGDAGAAALAACLREGAAPELKSISLGRNQIGDAGEAVLREAREGLRVLT